MSKQALNLYAAKVLAEYPEYWCDIERFELAADGEGICTYVDDNFYYYANITTNDTQLLDTVDALIKAGKSDGYDCPGRHWLVQHSTRQAMLNFVQACMQEDEG